MDLLSPALGDHTHDEATLALAAARQRAWAERLLAEDPTSGWSSWVTPTAPVVADRTRAAVPQSRRLVRRISLRGGDRDGRGTQGIQERKR